jgi:hypothetical protein
MTSNVFLVKPLSKRRCVAPAGASSICAKAPTASAVGYGVSSLTGLVITFGPDKDAPDYLIGGAL